MNAVAGNFTYPPQNSNLKFDYRDSVVTSWVSDDAYATQGVLSLWYWLLNGQINWTVSVIEAVPANGSKSVALDVGAPSDFLSQFNINYNSEDGSQQKYVSPIITIVHSPGAKSDTVTWNQQALSTSSSTSLPSSSSTLATSTIAATAPAATTLVGTSAASPRLSTAASHLDIAVGLGLGIPLSIAATGFIASLFWRQRRPDNRGSVKRFSDSKSTAPVSKGRMIRELDAGYRECELAVGRLEVELDGNQSTM